MTVLSILVVNSTFAATVAKKKATKETTATPSTAATSSNSALSPKLTTDAQFSDQVVGGQYQVPFEAVSTVENEKRIDALIGVRKNFHDRIEKSKNYRDTK